MNLLSLGKNPISSDQPAGTDARYEPEFEVLQAEIDKLSSPSSTDGIDWQKVAEGSALILSEKSKDLLVGSYLAVSQIHIRQIDGLSVGLTVMHDLVNEYWDTLFPPKNRMRGRIAAIEWWLEKSETALKSLTVEPQPADKIEIWKINLNRINTVLQKYLEEAPLLRPIERFIEGIPVRGDKKPSFETPPSAKEKSEIQPVSKKHTSTSANDTSEMPSALDQERLLRDALQTVRRVSDYFLDENLSDPRGYRLRRIAGWAMIQTLPPVNNGRTQIPPPIQYDTILNNLKTLKDKSNWEALARNAEERFQGALLWLDLNRFTAEAMASLGDSFKNAYDAICQETSFLLFRLPGIENLSFSDGIPFADTETKQWLMSISVGGDSTMEHSVSPVREDDYMEETIQEALSLVKKKKLEEAVTSIQREIRRSYSKKDRLLWRLGLTHVLINANKPILAMPHLELILQDINIYKLEEWDSDLALKSFKMVWNGLKIHADNSVKEKLDGILNCIAKLDPAEALRLNK
jgi:type VI secretion system protein VasJ